jgi:hypothetical protein
MVGCNYFHPGAQGSMNISVLIEKWNKMNLNQSDIIHRRPQSTRFARAKGRSQAGHAKIEPEIAEKLKSNLFEAWRVPQITDRMCDCYSTE